MTPTPEAPTERLQLPGEDADLHRRDELEKDIQDVIMAVETEEGRKLSSEERTVVEETFRAAIGATLIEPDESQQ